MDFKNKKSFLTIIKIIKEISINKILNNEIEDPNIIEIGIIENSVKK